MLRRTSAAAAALVLSLAAAPAAHGQFVRLGLGGGVSKPTGDLDNTAKLGYNGLVTVGVGVPLIPIALRADGMFNQWNAKEAVGSGTLRLYSASANVSFSLPVPILTPYAIGGVGYYNSKVKGATSSNSDFGYNVGAGVRINTVALHLFVEARYHHVNAGGGAMTFVPVTAGIMF